MFFCLTMVDNIRSNSSGVAITSLSVALSIKSFYDSFMPFAPALLPWGVRICDHMHDGCGLYRLLEDSLELGPPPSVKIEIGAVK